MSNADAFPTVRVTIKEPNAVHSHDRSMVASLGFADPDKKDRRHDLACQYLATAEVGARIVDRILNPLLQSRDCIEDGLHGGHTFRGSILLRFDHFERPLFETAIVKGKDQYRTVVGFLDLVLPYRFAVLKDGESLGFPTTRNQTSTGVWKPTVKSELAYPVFQLIVEVKVNDVGVGDILRQINLYDQFVSRPLLLSTSAYGLTSRDSVIWCIATVFTPDPRDVMTLHSAGIRHVQLGEAFDAWCRASREDAKPAESISL